VAFFFSLSLSSLFSFNFGGWGLCVCLFVVLAPILAPLSYANNPFGSDWPLFSFSQEAKLVGNLEKHAWCLLVTTLTCRFFFILVVPLGQSVGKPHVNSYL
jgi:hypothetical protein